MRTGDAEGRCLRRVSADAVRNKRRIVARWPWRPLYQEFDWQEERNRRPARYKDRFPCQRGGCRDVDQAGRGQQQQPIDGEGHNAAVTASAPPCRGNVRWWTYNVHAATPAPTTPHRGRTQASRSSSPAPPDTAQEIAPPHFLIGVVATAFAAQHHARPSVCQAGWVEDLTAGVEARTEVTEVSGTWG